MRLDLAFRKKGASLPTAENKESKNYPIRRSRDSLPSLVVIEGPVGGLFIQTLSKWVDKVMGEQRTAS